MKRISALILLLCLSFMLFACESTENSDGFLISKTAMYDGRYRIDDVGLDSVRDGTYLRKGGEEYPIYENIIMELMDLTPDKLTEGYKADLTRRLELLNYEYHWNDDNSLTIISEGEEMTFGKTAEWPDSPEYVKRLPVPEGITLKKVETGYDSVTITVSMTADEAKAYAEQLKDAGFTHNSKVITITGYTYIGTDDDGYSVNVTYTSLFQQIEITAADDEDDPGTDPAISDELPTTGIIEYLTAITFGKVESVYDTPDFLTVSISGVSSSVGTSFIGKCKDRFSSYVLNDTEEDGMVMYIGLNDDDVTCSVVFIGELLTISLSK